MKKLLVVLLTALVLFGCSSSKEVVGGDLDDIKKRGYVIIAMEGTWAPWTYHDETDALVGYDVEVGKYIAKYLGVEAQFVEGEWDGLLAGVEAGRYDMMINGCDVTDERKQVYDFSDAYAYDKTVVITTDDRNDINTLEDLNGKKTANTASSIYAAIAEQYGASVDAVDDLNETFMLLSTGRIDATLNSEATFNYYVKVNPDSNFKVTCSYGNAADIAIPMKKGASALVAKVNEAIAAARSDGTLSALSIKYFGSDMTAE